MAGGVPVYYRLPAAGDFAFDADEFAVEFRRVQRQSFALVLQIPPVGRFRRRIWKR